MSGIHSHNNWKPADLGPSQTLAWSLRGQSGRMSGCGWDGSPVEIQVPIPPREFGWFRLIMATSQLQGGGTMPVQLSMS